MSDFDDTDESIFSDASSSYLDDILSDEPPSEDSMDDSIGEVEESFMETESNESKLWTISTAIYLRAILEPDFTRPGFMIPMEDMIKVGDSIKTGRRTIRKYYFIILAFLITSIRAWDETWNTRLISSSTRDLWWSWGKGRV